MGKPVNVPMIRIMATEEGQTGNIYDTVYFNLTDDDCLLSKVPGVDPGRTRILLPSGGNITPSTASSASKDGGKETFVAFDETHLYNTPELRRMYKTVTRNTVKLRGTASEPWYLETTTMFGPGELSVAELTYREAELIRSGKKVHGRIRLFFDHRWGICEDLTDVEALTKAITDAFGDAIAWQSIEAILDEFYSLHADPADSRRYFLNAETSSSDSWLDIREVEAISIEGRALAPKDVITLGFDGSIGGDDADATALVACRVSDGHLQLLALWERPENLPPARKRPPPKSKVKAKTLGAAVEAEHDEDLLPEHDEDDLDIGEWRIDEVAVDAAVDDAFKTYNVVGFFLDPPHWSSHTAKWTAQYGKQLKARATLGRPLEFWTNQPSKMAQALGEFLLGVKGKQVSIERVNDAMPDEKQQLAVEFRRHLLNAYRRPTRFGLQIRKEYQKSPRKIDATVAAVLAYTARQAAITAGVKTVVKKKVARRLR